MLGILTAVNPVLIILTEMPLIHRFEKANPLRLIGLAELFIAFGFGPDAVWQTRFVLGALSFVGFTLLARSRD